MGHLSYFISFFSVLCGLLVPSYQLKALEWHAKPVLQEQPSTNLPKQQTFASYQPAEGLACGLTGPASDSCPDFMTCGGDGRTGICGCTPRSSYPSGACGVYQDNCGGYVDFGGCSNGQICGGNGLCQSLASAESISCGATLQSNKHYKFSGGSSSGTCFSIAGSLSNVVFDGDGKTLSAATAFFINNGAQNIVIKNFVIDATTGIGIGTNVSTSLANCNGLPQNIRIQSNRFIRGGIDMGSTTSAACNLRIEGNRIEEGSIGLSHYSFNNGLGGHIIVDNVLEQRASLGSALTIQHLDNVLLLNNSVQHLVTIWDVRRMAILENKFHVTGAIGGTDNNGVSMMQIREFGRSLFAGNYVRNQESSSPSAYRMAVNTYNSQRSSYLWNTILQELPSPNGGTEQMALNFRSAGNDNFIYRNYLRSLNQSGYALKTLAASASCEIDLDSGASGACNPYRNVIDSNELIGSQKALYLADSGSSTIRNNVLVGGSNGAVYGCGSPNNTFVHNLFDGGTTGFDGTSCSGSFNNLVYNAATNASWFKNRSAQDYHLLSGAGAINQVSINTLARVDLAGISRPFGANADSGPYEFINDSQDPNTPANLGATTMSWSRIRLNWSAATDNDAISHYNVYVFNGSSFVLLKKVPYTRAYDLGLSSNTLYRYKVSSVDRSGRESALSAEVSATTAAGAINPPPGDTLAPGAPSGLILN